jgi:hypothetical protein
LEQMIELMSGGLPDMNIQPSLQLLCLSAPFSLVLR